MNIAAEITPLFLLGTLAFLGWGFWRARRRGSLAVWVWLQGSLLLLPWVVFLGLLLLGIYLNFAGFLVLLLVFTGLYIAVGRKTRQLAQQELQARREQLARLEEQGEAPSAGEAPLEAPAVLQRISAEDLQAIQSIFGLDTFFVTETVPYGEGAIFKGNLRQEAEVVVPLLVEKLKEQVGSRYQLFLVEDPAEKPAVVVLPDPIVNYRASVGAQILAGALLVFSFVATLEVGANLLGFRLLDAPGRWVEALPVAAGIFAILLVHETGHRWMAGKYGVRLSPAFVIPSLGIGTLGSLNRIQSPVPSRKALFDIAFAGPAASGILSLLVLLAGLKLSGSEGLYVPTEIFRSSILVGTLARLVLGSQLQAELVPIHPFVAVGWIGLAITALSLLPAGQLDGGRIVQAVYGRKTAARATFITLIALAVAAISNVLALYWALLILFIAREPERPPQDEITETDGQRDALALLALFLMVMTLLPIAPALAGFLNFPNG
ncbi:MULTISPECIES: site-2 protease family protein [unclassified Synechococcus]|jgi:Predicted membrane-associated Zn-dependent proteases 1|uniref:site-2 protease family protein n=2 Tax=Synechococcus TaxID=1129 RepID=UPI0000694E25|nr:site-2 protease family protein [Synechococcus sp. JA-2-3B'a(2-13)]ABD02230.1 putative membrane protein [Synechococcus sp. JA-2-3B'a(2-13)]